jgi:hypothetical protein
MKFKRIKYNTLNARQKESYNFQKVSSILADYGFTTIKLADDWQGADFLAQHMDGKQIIKIQLKGRLTVDKKYLKKDLLIAFPYESKWYLFHHDKVVKELVEWGLNYQNTDSWKSRGRYSWNSINEKIQSKMAKYII